MALALDMASHLHETHANNNPYFMLVMCNPCLIDGQTRRTKMANIEERKWSSANERQQRFPERSKFFGAAVDDNFGGGPATVL